jgi:flagellar hook-associated protein 3 FlgL
MISTITSSTDRFLATLARLNSRMNTLQQQIGTGKKVAAPSDAPDQISDILTMRATQARLDQINANVSRVKSETDTAESTLNSVISVFDRLRVVAQQGANGTQTAATRATLADEVASLMERMVASANTESGGRFLFAGDSDQTAPFTLDWTQPQPWSAYGGTATTRQILHPAGITFAVDKTAQDIFDNADPTKNVFQAMDDVRKALLANDSAQIATSLEPLAGVSGHLNSMLSFYGNVQDRVAEAADTTAKMKLSLQTELANAEDSDLVAATVELTQLRLQQEAALQVQGSIPRKSLFDYLG